MVDERDVLQVMLDVDADLVADRPGLLIINRDRPDGSQVGEGYYLQPAGEVTATGRGGNPMLRNSEGGDRGRSRVTYRTPARRPRTGGRRGAGRGGGRPVRVGRERW